MFDSIPSGTPFLITVIVSISDPLFPAFSSLYINTSLGYSSSAFCLMYDNVIEPSGKLSFVFEFRYRLLNDQFISET